MTRDSTAVTQTWAKAAGRLADHKRDYVIEVLRERAMKSAKSATKSAEGKAKVKKKSAAATRK